MAKTAQLEEFDEALYNIAGGVGADGKENEDNSKYLIATSEQPISCFHANEWFAEVYFLNNLIPLAREGSAKKVCWPIHLLQKRGWMSWKGDLGYLPSPSV